MHLRRALGTFAVDRDVRVRDLTPDVDAGSDIFWLVGWLAGLGRLLAAAFSSWSARHGVGGSKSYFFRAAY